MPSLPECPECRYSLKGLPEKHACPECGLRYDEHSVVHRTKVPFAVYGGLLGFLGGVPGFVQMFRAIRLELAIVISFLFVAAFAVATFVVVRFARRGWMAAAVVDGLHLRFQGTSQKVIAWSNISRATLLSRKLNRGWRNFRFGATIFLKSERRTLDVIGVFKSEEEASAFVDTINHYVSTQSDAPAA